MALYKTVTKMFPTQSVVGLHLELEDDDRPDLGTGKQKVIDRDFTENFTRGQGTINAVRNSIGKKIQEAIGEYRESADIFRSAKYETMRTQIDNNLQL